MMLKKAGANRVADLRIDAAAKDAARAVRAADNGGASERFLRRFVDHLHDTDNARILAPHAPPDDASARRRRRRRAD
jgi:hypothetical protein